MARRTQLVTIYASEDSPDNRDVGKTYLLTEMPARQAEDWGVRALLALANAGTEIPDGFEFGGMSAIAAIGLDALQGLKFEVVKPLMDEMFSCIQIVPEPRHPEVVRALVDDDIEEVQTRLMLRREIVGLHINFSALASLSKSLQAQAKTQDPFEGGEITRTSPAR